MAQEVSNKKDIIDLEWTFSVNDKELTIEVHDTVNDRKWMAAFAEGSGYLQNQGVAQLHKQLQKAKDAAGLDGLWELDESADFIFLIQISGLELELSLQE